MNTLYFFTGFPGFIASNIIKKLLQTNPLAEFVLLVHPSQQTRAETEVRELIARGYGTGNQFLLVQGDITLENFGLHDQAFATLCQRIDYVFHLAAIYDLAVPKDFAHLVNVVGTGNVNRWVQQLPRLQRYVYFSTAYVSGTRQGLILERELEMGQSFKNHYESTKYEAEVLVQQIRAEVPTTVIRPGIVMGDSKTGETVKFDGPYFMMRFLDRFAKFPIPYVGKGDAKINLVPVDYIVDATCHLAHLPAAAGRVYHLTDPAPYTAREAYEMICENLIEKKPSWTIPTTLVSGALSIQPFREWTMVEKETVAYFNCPAEYAVTHTLQDLSGSGIQCPDFRDYIKTAVQFYKEQRNDPSKRIMVR